MSRGEYLRGRGSGSPQTRTWDTHTPLLIPPKHIRLASEQYASYWNAFLLGRVILPQISLLRQLQKGYTYSVTLCRNLDHMLSIFVIYFIAVAGVPNEKFIEAHGSFSTATCRVCFKVYTGEEIKVCIHFQFILSDDGK